MVENYYNKYIYTIPPPPPPNKKRVEPLMYSKIQMWRQNISGERLTQKKKMVHSNKLEQIIDNYDNFCGNNGETPFNTGVSLFQGAGLKGVSLFQGAGLEGFHC